MGISPTAVGFRTNRKSRPLLRSIQGFALKTHELLETFSLVKTQIRCIADLRFLLNYLPSIFLRYCPV